MNEKDFDGWMKVKEKLHFGASQPHIREGDIWWCSFGENVGVEINGKNKLFSRPVLVYKKLSRFGFIGIPLTSQDKHGSWYIKFDFQNRKQTLVLSQFRAFSVSRLSSRMGELNADDMKSIRKSLLFFRVKIFPTLASWAAGIPECVFIILYFDVKINCPLVWACDRGLKYLLGRDYNSEN